MSISYRLDDSDISILELLQTNGKISSTQIANELNIAESTIRYRIERLEKRGIISNYIALIDPRKVGLNITAIMMIKLIPQNINQISETLAKFKELRHLFRVTGQYDMISVVNTKDIAHLNRLLEDIKLINGIKEVILEVATELIKMDPRFHLR
jgi:DNA-binding Lrp family transcriptional regulator